MIEYNFLDLNNVNVSYSWEGEICCLLWIKNKKFDFNLW